MHSNEAKAVEVLLRHGADLNAQDSMGMNVLDIALSNENKLVLAYILSASRLDCKPRTLPQKVSFSKVHSWQQLPDSY